MGISGRTITDRVGLQRLVTEVTMGHACCPASKMPTKAAFTVPTNCDGFEVTVEIKQ
ncbi:hypothetical protein ABZ896_15295 [Streptomyces sp. NPDC047072]|uniref:hypothetical protein n=1 Tax=Streptomyces sp. NPDC047072 TaxID=3154809 RepID=UPI00340C30C1